MPLQLHIPCSFLCMSQFCSVYGVAVYSSVPWLLVLLVKFSAEIQECWEDNPAPMRCYKENCCARDSDRLSFRKPPMGAVRSDIWQVLTEEIRGRGIEHRRMQLLMGPPQHLRVADSKWFCRQEQLGSSGSLCLSECHCVNEKWFEPEKNDWRWRAGGRHRGVCLPCRSLS